MLITRRQNSGQIEEVAVDAIDRTPSNQAEAVEIDVDFTLSKQRTKRDTRC